jgi:hypothetical protein
MTDPMTPNHDQPVEGSRNESYTAPDDGNIGESDPAASAADAGAGAAAKANDVLETLREAVEDFAEKATPVVRQFSAKAAEVVATAADKAVPLAQKAGEVTADASGKLAVKSRSWAAEVRESLSSNGSTDKTDKTEPPTTI